SATATVSMCQYTQSVTGAASQNTYPGQSVHLVIASTPSATSYRWYKGLSGDRSTPLTAWTANNYFDDAPTVTTSYWADVVAGSCTSNTTTTTVTVCLPNITQQPASTTIANG